LYWYSEVAFDTVMRPQDPRKAKVNLIAEGDEVARDVVHLPHGYFMSESMTMPSRE